jgi:hypothetical protein
MRKLLVISLFLAASLTFYGQRLPGVVSASGQVTTSASTLIKGLVSLWDHDDGVTGTTIDSKDGNNGTVTGATQNQAEAKIGKSVLFDASGEEINCGNPTNLRTATHGTISAWVYTTTTGATTGAIVSNENYNTDRSGVSFVRSGKNIYVFIASAAAMQYHNNTTALSINTWYHVVFTWNSSGNMCTYVNNGTPKTDAMTLTPDMTVHDWHIGNSPVTDIPWAGYIDCVRIWNRELAAAGVDSLYTKENAGTTYPWN